MEAEMHPNLRVPGMVYHHLLTDEAKNYKTFNIVEISFLLIIELKVFLNPILKPNSETNNKLQKII